MEITVDDRVFVVGLSELFRQEMKAYEVATLLPLAEAACEALNLSPATVPVEGYYWESEDLERFFRLVRALQSAEMRTVSPGPGERAIHRLRTVFSSSAMGRVEESDYVLPRASSPFGEALRISADWSVDGVSGEAQHLVRSSDAGLVAVACATGDPIAVCVARESVALTAATELMAVVSPHFVWSVSERVVDVAERFVSSLAEATGIVLPKPEAASSRVYGEAAKHAELADRCIMVGARLGTSHPFYHWYIAASRGTLAVRDFWSSEIWTTEAMRNSPPANRPAAGQRVDAPEAGNGSPFNAGSSPLRHVEEHDERFKQRGWLARLFQRSRWS